MEELLDLKKLNTFVKIAELGSFFKAAVTLGYTPSAVSIQIQQLEQELGIRLFDRFGKHVHLTDEGETFFSYAGRILRLSEEAKNAVKGENEPLTGMLRIGTIDSICDTLFPQLLEEFYRENPKVTVNITVNTPSKLLEELKCNNIDIVMLLDKPYFSKDLVVDMQLPTDIIFCASKNHPLSGKEEIDLAEILRYPCILTEKIASYRYILENRLAEVGMSILPSIESQNTNLIIKLLCSHMGYSVLPRFLIEQKLRDNKLSILPIKDFAIQVNYQVIHGKDKFVNRQMTEFMKTVRRQAAGLQV